MSLTSLLFENIACDGSFKHFVFVIVFAVVFVFVFVCVSVIVVANVIPMMHNVLGLT